MPTHSQRFQILTIQVVSDLITSLSFNLYTFLRVEDGAHNERKNIKIGNILFLHICLYECIFMRWIVIDDGQFHGHIG